VKQWVSALVVVLLLAGPAWAQLDSREAIQLQNQIAELRRDVQALREQMRSQGSGSTSIFGGTTRPAPPTGGDMTAALLDRVAVLEEQVRRMQGKLDEVDNARQRQGDELKKDIEDLNFKVGAVPAGRPATPPAASVAPAAAPSSPAAAAAPARRTPEIAMQEGNAALARRDYAGAEAAAREVLRFPQSPRATDAQFLLAQSLAGKRDFQAAAVAYDDTYNRARSGTLAQPSLLGLANSLTSINEKRAACVTLDKLKAEFPNPRADLREPIAAARQRAGCR